MMGPRRWWPGVTTLTLTLAGGLPGCATRNTDLLHFLREHEHKVSAIEYRVGIPDAVEISAPRVLEIDGEVQRIQPDGKVNLKLVGEVKVVGMTAKEIAAKLEVLLSRYYLEPKVRVRVVKYASKKYYVHGQAGATGPRPYTGRDTLLDAVLAAGVDFRSWTSKVEVTRPAHGDRPVRRIQVDVDKMLQTGDWRENILLEPDDVVYIPPTPLAWVAQRTQELVYPVRPAVRAYSAPAYLMYADDTYDEEYRGRFVGRY
ncbi:MAG: polysaccharide biosynthesis/export family protein [Phycisphaerae bacterium]|jgi:polysaccharide export outer membrane protein